MLRLNYIGCNSTVNPIAAAMRYNVETLSNSQNQSCSGFFLFSFARISEVRHYRLMLQRCQRPLPGAEVELCQSLPQFGVQRYPAVELRRRAARSGVREVGLGEVAHVDCFHFLNLELRMDNRVFGIKKLPISSCATTYR